MPLKKTSITKAILIIFSITIFTKPLTFIKEIATANYFGGSENLEAFLIAFLIPNFIFSLVGGILSSCFIPVYVNERNTRTNRGTELINSFMVFIVVAGFIFAFAIYIFAPIIIRILAPGFADNRYHLAVYYLQKFCPYMFMLFLIYYLTNLLQAEKQFFFYAIAPFIINLGAFTFLIFFHTTLSIMSLICGYYVGAATSLILLLIKSRKYFHLSETKMWIKSETEILKLTIPIAIGVSIHWLINVSDNFFASMLSHGSVTAMYYAQILITYLNTFIAFSITNASLPFLSEYYLEGNIVKYVAAIQNNFINLLIIYFPVTLIFYFFNDEIITLLYFSKNVDLVIASKTKIALSYYAFCLIPLGFHAIFLPVYYSKKDTKTPMIVAFFTALINIFLNYILVKYYDLAGIVIASLVAVTIQAIAHIIINKIKLLMLSEAWKVIFTGAIMVLLMKIFIFFDLGTNIHYRDLKLNFVVILFTGLLFYVAVIFTLNVNNHRMLLKSSLEKSKLNQFLKSTKIK